MDRRITGFHLDSEQHWVADLECGHTQHVRHDPPWQLRPWVLSEKSRREHLGTMLDCRLCDPTPPTGTAATSASDRYLDAKLQGLCDEGAEEVAQKGDPPPRNQAP